MTIILQSTKLQPTKEAPNKAALQEALYRKAKEYIARGWHIFPLLKDTKNAPLIKWQENAHLVVTDMQGVEKWWGVGARSKNSNIAIKCEPSNLFVIDFDTRNENYGNEAEALRQQIHNLPLSHRPPFYRSRSGGYHYYFRHNHTADPLGNSTSTLAAGVDTRGVGGYIVAPPSVVLEKNEDHPLFEHYAHYQTDDDSMTFEVIPTMPDELLDYVRAALASRPRTEAPQSQPQPTTRPTTAPAGGLVNDDGVFVDAYKWFNGKVDAALRKIDNATTGTRHNDRLRAGRILGGALAKMREHGYAVMSDEAAENLLYDRRPPTDNHEIERETIRFGLNSGINEPLQPEPRRTPVKAPQRPTEAPNVQMLGNDTDDGNEAIGWRFTYDKYAYTDNGNGDRFIEAAAGRLRFVEETKQWLLWDGQRWRKVSELKVIHLAQQIARQLYDEAKASNKDGAGSWAAKSNNNGRIEDMVANAKPRLSIYISELDKKPHLLTVANGTIDLRTGQLIASTPEHYLTRMTPIEYDPYAEAPAWRAFLNKIFHGDTPDGADLITYIQRAVGYTLTGHTDSECLFFLFGDGANGKTTFVNVLGKLLTQNEFYKSTNIEAILAGDRESRGAANPFLVDMVGMRLITANELPMNRRLNENLVKELTGNDLIAARQIYGTVFHFRPECKYWISGNHKPRVVDDSRGIWRRMRLIPFTYTFTEAEQRPSMEVMREFEHELTGILAWAVRGAIEWYNLGDQRAAFDPPAIVKMATADYRKDEDLVERFINDRCVIDDNASAEKGALFQQFIQWGKDTGEVAVRDYTKNSLTAKLIRRGHNHTGAGRSKLSGIGLKSDAKLF